MPLPERFETATFDRYAPATPSQAEALRTARQVVEAQRRTPSWTERLKRWMGAENGQRSKGLYLVGPAGTGKTHLLAAMYHALTPEVSCAFLHSSTLFRQTEPPDAFAHRLADEHAVCCLDEVEIDDPANEMRLVQVMKTLADRGVLLLATSNVEPEQYLSSQFSESRFQRFLHREFRAQYRVVFVRGEDYRRTEAVQQSGRGWIGPPARTRAAMQEVRSNVSGEARRWSFADLRRATTEIAHPDLIDDLTTLDHLFVEDIAIDNTDDALRLLRVIDALYLHEDAPTLYFTAERPPDAWFDPDRHAGVARAVAEKFERTVSRLHALCRLQRVGEETPAA
jgi:cell division protein ZapE